MSTKDTAVVEGVAADTSGSETTAAESSLAGVATDLDIVAEAAQMFGENDPDFAKFAGLAKTDTDGDGPDDDTGEGSTVDTDADAGAADGEDSGEAAVEFEDNVIEGVSGAEFAKLSEDAQVALATYREATAKKVAEAEAAKARVDALMTDPVVRSRVAMIDSGVTDASIPVRGISEQEKTTIANRIMAEVGVDESEAMACLAAIESGLNEVINDAARDLAQSMAGNVMAAQENHRRVAETNKQGNDLLLSLSQFNSSLAVRETNLSNFYRFEDGRFVLNAAHPEAETFKNGLGRVMGWLEAQGMGYDGVVRLGPKALYAAAAAALDMPVAMNTGERDKKIAVNARKAALKPFLKASGTGAGSTLNPDGGSVVQKRTDAEARIVHGMDAVKLVEDAAYYHEMVAKSFGNLDGMDNVLEAQEAGRAIINKRKT